MTEEKQPEQNQQNQAESELDMLRRNVRELLSFQDKYREAARVWDDLELKQNDQVVEAVIFAKIVNFEGEGTAVGIGHTAGMDWIGQIGLLEAGKLIIKKDLYGTVGDDDD